MKKGGGTLAFGAFAAYPGGKGVQIVLAKHVRSTKGIPAWGCPPPKGRTGKTPWFPPPPKEEIGKKKSTPRRNRGPSSVPKVSFSLLTAGGERKIMAKGRNVPILEKRIG